MSVHKLLSTIYPDYDWLPWKFNKAHHNFWDDVNNQRKFMNWVGKEINIKQLDDWYKVTSYVFDKFYKKLICLKDVIKLGGSRLLSLYNDSISKLLSTIYPQHEWLPWKFSKTPKYHWDSTKNQKEFMEWVSKQLNIKEMSDWYRVKFIVINILVVHL